MDEQGTTPAAGPGGCVFCGRPVAGAEACPLLPSSHWACCACQAPEPASSDAA
jgi:hypothetical protein